MIVISEFDLSITKEQFLAEFAHVLKGFYPGVEEMLRELSEKFVTACLTNMGELHWGHLCNITQIDKLIQKKFVSYKTGLLKPDKEVFQYIITELGFAPDRILFFDDNQMNVDAAIEAGNKAFKVKGFDELKSQLVLLGV